MGSMQKLAVLLVAVVIGTTHGRITGAILNDGVAPPGDGQTQPGATINLRCELDEEPRRTKTIGIYKRVGGDEEKIASDAALIAPYDKDSRFSRSSQWDNLPYYYDVTITDAEVKDAGVYRCEERVLADDSVSQTENFAEVVIFEQPAAVEVTDAVDSKLELVVGSQTIKCSARGGSTPVMTMKVGEKDAVEMQVERTSDNGTLMYTGSATVDLTVADDGASLQCEAKVQTFDAVLSRAVTLAVKSKPEINCSPTETTIKDGAVASFSCEVTGSNLKTDTLTINSKRSGITLEKNNDWNKAELGVVSTKQDLTGDKPGLMVVLRVTGKTKPTMTYDIYTLSIENDVGISSVEMTVNEEKQTGEVSDGDGGNAANQVQSVFTTLFSVLLAAVVLH